MPKKQSWIWGIAKMAKVHLMPFKDHKDFWRIQKITCRLPKITVDYPLNISEDFPTYILSKGLWILSEILQRFRYLERYCSLCLSDQLTLSCPSHWKFLFSFKPEYLAMKYAAVPVGNEMEWSFLLESFQMVHAPPNFIC